MDWGDSAVLMHCALLEVRLVWYRAQHNGSTVESVEEPRGRTNTTERKAKCKIKGRRHGVVKSSIRLYKTCVTRNRRDADRELSHQ